MSDVQLENCPFCDDGTPALVEFPEGNPRAGKWQVQCTNYFCCASGGAWETKEQATAVWNARDEMEREIRNIGGDIIRRAARI